MALQGTLDTFALPDVLRLLAATKKSGRLDVDGDRGSGSAWVAAGRLTAVVVQHAPLLTDPTEALSELLRSRQGSFSFDPEAAGRADIDADAGDLIESAEALLAEWREVEAIVPSPAWRVQLRAEVDTDEIHLDGTRWRAVVAVGSGATVAEVSERLGLGELPASRAVRDLVEAGLAELHEPLPAAQQREDPDGRLDVPGPEARDVTDLAPPHAGPVLADPDDAAGTAHPGPRARRARGRRSMAGSDDVFVPLELSGPVGLRPTPDEPSAEDLVAAFPGLSVPRAHREVAPGSEAPGGDGTEPAEAGDQDGDAAPAPPDAEAQPLNRGLLLKFLSSVKT